MAEGELGAKETPVVEMESEVKRQLRKQERQELDINALAFEKSIMDTVQIAAATVGKRHPRVLKSPTYYLNERCVPEEKREPAEKEEDLFDPAYKGKPRLKDELLGYPETAIELVAAKGVQEYALIAAIVDSETKEIASRHRAKPERKYLPADSSLKGLDEEKYVALVEKIYGSRLISDLLLDLKEAQGIQDREPGLPQAIKHYKLLMERHPALRRAGTSPAIANHLAVLRTFAGRKWEDPQEIRNEFDKKREEVDQR